MSLIWFVTLLSLVVRGRAATVVNEEVHVKWTNGRATKHDKHFALPDKVVLSLTIDNETVTLNLVKNQRDNFEDIPVVIGGENNNVAVWHHKKDEELSVYNDKSKEASFSVVVKKENRRTIAEYYGSFVHNEVKYSLIPENYHEMSNKTSDVVHEFTLNGTKYVVFIDKVDKFQKPVDDDLDPKMNIISPDLTDPRTPVQIPVETQSVAMPEQTEAVLGPAKTSDAENSALPNDPEVNEALKRQTTLNYESYSTEARSPRRKRNILPTLHVDLMVVIDYSMYSKWLKMNNNDHGKTVERMRYYLAHVLNGVNNVYATMPTPRLFVSVLEIFIAGTAQQSWYFENPRIKHHWDPQKANFEMALAAFRKWVLDHTPKKGEIQSREKFIPKHDAAVVFTDYDESPTEGLAYCGTVCGDYAQGLIHEKGQYDTITVAAHEIAHILGSKHDGDGNNCNPNDHFLMSPIMTHAKIEKRDILSNCTIEQIVKKAWELQWKNENCMDSSKKYRRRTNLDKLLDRRPGARFSADEQCQLRFGSDYKFCSEGEDTHMTICNRMTCFNTNDNQCYAGYPKALEGTTCGKNKWCIKGQCVYGGPVKPNTKDTCLFGDKNAAFMYGKVLTTCKIVKSQPYSCYNPDIKKWCCETCEEIKNEKNTGLASCLYGDKGAFYGCQMVFQRLDACNTPDVNEKCCESCNKARKAYKKPVTPEAPRRPMIPESRTPKNPEVCKDEVNLKPYGINIQCQSLYRNYAGCYQLDKYCCKTCSEIMRFKGIQGCPYGDRGAQLLIYGRVHNCDGVSLVPNVCITDPRIAELCCESCFYAKRYNRG